MIRSRGFCRLSPESGLIGFVLSVVGVIRRPSNPNRFLNTKRTAATPAIAAMMSGSVGRPRVSGIEGTPGTDDATPGMEGTPGNDGRPDPPGMLPSGFGMLGMAGIPGFCPPSPPSPPSPPGILGGFPNSPERISPLSKLES